MAYGWIKIYRSIWDNDLWVSEDPFDIRAAWIDLIMLANHEDGTVVEGRRKRIIKRGQHKTSMRKLAVRWHRSMGWVSRYLTMLQELGMITFVVNTNGTLITIENYGVFQDIPNTNDNTSSNTNKHTSDNTHRHTSRYTNGNKQEYKESKEDKEDKNIYSGPGGPRDSSKDDDWQ